MRNLEVNYRGVLLQAHGYYEEGESEERDYPGSGDQFDLQHLYANSKTDIYDMLETNQVYEIEKLCIKKINSNK